MRAPSPLDLLPEELLHEVFRQAGLHLGSGAWPAKHRSRRRSREGGFLLRLCAAPCNSASCCAWVPL